MAQQGIGRRAKEKVEKRVEKGGAKTERYWPGRTG